jgi:hypothetical protein
MHKKQKVSKNSGEGSPRLPKTPISNVSSGDKIAKATNRTTKQKGNK